MGARFERIYPEDDFQWRRLQRDGYCSRCGQKIQRNTKNILTFLNRKGHYDQVILCGDCCDYLAKILRDVRDVNNEQFYDL